MFKVNNSVTKLTPKGLKVILLSVLLNVNRNFAAELAYLAIKPHIESTARHYINVQN